MTGLGIVIIGRNEGERLRRCVDSVRGPGVTLVYVDSGSVDGSSAWVRAQGVGVVELDPARPFSAARARNEGFHRALQINPGVKWVQFVDGDCELAPGWLEQASQTLEGDASIAAACGRLREKLKDTSIYARLCDMEWDGPTGIIDSCGGVAMFQRDALLAVGGFPEDLTGTEERELCQRLGLAGYRVVRVSQSMGSHDSNMTHFVQWWRRMKRNGSMYAQAIAAGHGDRYRWRQALRAVWWAGLLPIGTGACIVAGYWYPLLLCFGPVVGLAYAIQILRIRSGRRRRGDSDADSWLYGVFCMLSKWPQLLGQVQFLAQRAGEAINRSVR